MGGFPIIPVLIAIGKAVAKYFAYQYIYRKLNPRPATPDFQIPLNTRRQYLTAPDAPQRIGYGEFTIAPTIIADFSTDQHLNILGALTPHELENDIIQLLVDDQEFLSAAELASLNRDGYVMITANSANDGISELRKTKNKAAQESSLPILYIAKDFTAPAVNPQLGGAGGNYSSKIESFRARAGTNETSFLARANFGMNGKAERPLDLDMRMTGQSWVHLAFPRSKRARDANNKDPDVWSSVPTLTFRVRRPLSSLKISAEPGAPIIGSGALYNNAALCAYDYLARYTDYGTPIRGEGGLIFRIDGASVAASYNQCQRDNLVANGVVQLTTPPADVLEQLGYAMNAGIFPEKHGVRFIESGRASSATTTLTDEDIVEDSYSYAPRADITTRASQLVARYVDEDGLEQSAAADYDTSVVSVQDIQLDLIDNKRQAEQVARILLSKLWTGAALSFELVGVHPELSPNDVVRVEGCGPLNLADDFRILALEQRPNGNTRVSCQFEDPNLFTLREDDDGYIPASRLPNYDSPVAAQDAGGNGILVDDSNLLIATGADGQTHFITYNTGDDNG